MAAGRTLTLRWEREWVIVVVVVVVVVMMTEEERVS